MLINGRDISEHTHDQVVMFIKASRESHTRELALVIRRKGNSALGGGAAAPAALAERAHHQALLPARSLVLKVLSL